MKLTEKEIDFIECVLRISLEHSMKKVEYNKLLIKFKEKNVNKDIEWSLWNKIDER